MGASNRELSYAGLSTSRQHREVAGQSSKAIMQAAPAARSTVFEQVFNRQSGFEYPPAGEYYSGFAGLSTESTDQHKAAHKSIGAPAKMAIVGRVIHGSDDFHDLEADAAWRAHLEGRAGKSQWDPYGEGICRRFYTGNDPREGMRTRTPKSARSGSTSVEVYDSGPAAGTRPPEHKHSGYETSTQYLHPYLKHVQESEVFPHLAKLHAREDLHHPDYIGKYGGAAGLHTWELGTQALRHHAGFQAERPAAANDPVL